MIEFSIVIIFIVIVCLINKRRKKYSFTNEKMKNDNGEYYFITVKFENSDKTYNYTSNDFSVKPGDKVLVRANGRFVVVDVVDSSFYKSDETPYQVEKTNNILLKVDDDFDFSYFKKLNEKNSKKKQKKKYFNELIRNMKKNHNYTSVSRKHYITKSSFNFENSNWSSGLGKTMREMDMIDSMFGNKQLDGFEEFLINKNILDNMKK